MCGIVAEYGTTDTAELAYYRIFRERLVGVRPEQTLSRFATA